MRWRKNGRLANIVPVVGVGRGRWAGFSDMLVIILGIYMLW